MADNNEPHVRVTLTEIYKVVVETRDKVEALDEKVGNLAEAKVDHEKRIRNLEWMNRGAFVALAGFAVEWLNRAIS